MSGGPADAASGDTSSVWLDDVRQPPVGWIWVRTPEDAIDLLKSGRVTVLSLDHDLGLATPDAERTGYDVLRWLEAEIGAGRWKFPLPELRIHSANPVGVARMRRAIETIERLHYH